MEKLMYIEDENGNTTICIESQIGEYENDAAIIRLATLSDLEEDLGSGGEGFEGQWECEEGICEFVPRSQMEDGSENFWGYQLLKGGIGRGIGMGKKVNVYESREMAHHGGYIIARVEYNNNLDTDLDAMHGNHYGLTRLKNGRFVKIEGTDYSYEANIAYIISDDAALQYVLESGNDELFKKYPALEELKNEMLIEEA